MESILLAAGGGGIVLGLGLVAFAIYRKRKSKKLIKKTKDQLEKQIREEEAMNRSRRMSYPPAMDREKVEPLLPPQKIPLAEIPTHPLPKKGIGMDPKDKEEHNNLLKILRENDRAAEQREADSYLRYRNPDFDVASLKKHPADKDLKEFLSTRTGERFLSLTKVNLEYPTEELGFSWYVDSAVDPVRITGLETNKAFHRSNVPRGGYIVGINGKQIDTVDDMRAAFQAAKNIGLTTLYVHVYEKMPEEGRRFNLAIPSDGRSLVRGGTGRQLTEYESLIKDAISNDVEDIHYNWVEAQESVHRMSHKTPPLGPDIPPRMSSSIEPASLSFQQDEQIALKEIESRRSRMPSTVNSLPEFIPAHRRRVHGDQFSSRGSGNHHHNNETSPGVDLPYNRQVASSIVFDHS
eukprot:TRINITY_DN10027_c0_g1_i1.p1 TRINITY_DN10027_c0_g1~~TRINITY_DN10027_c0_g1_i1.p1  ORF type:complete len:407 (+),score=90.87 TRINITY_DN10027_c0_g1_i1:155-1375(+)